MQEHKIGKRQSFQQVMLENLDSCMQVNKTRIHPHTMHQINSKWLKIIWPQVSGLISGFFILLYWSVCLFWYLSHTLLMTVALQHCLRSGRVMPPAWFLFLRTALAILGLLWLHINFWIVCSSSVKNVMGNLIGIVLSL